MIGITRICQKCGAEIPADAPEGGCPGCLFESGLGLLPDAPLAADEASTVTMTQVDDGGSAENIEANAADGARHLRDEFRRLPDRDRLAPDHFIKLTSFNKPHAEIT